MVPSPSWTLLSNQRLMVLCPSLYTGNLHIQTSIYSGTATITSQPSLVSSKPSPIGPPLCAAILSCSKKKRTTSGKLSPNAITPNGPWTRWRKDLTGLPDRLMMGAITLPSLPTLKCKVRVTLSYPTHKVFVKVSERSVVGMASKPTSRVAEPSKTFWSPPKDKDPMLNQSGAIYRYQCSNLGCDDEYIGETSRTFGERYKEHLKAPSAIHHHSIQTGHPTNQNNFQIVGREGHNLARNIKESIYIRVNNPSLNNNIGKFNLSHIWDRVLLNTKGLTLK